MAAQNAMTNPTRYLLEIWHFPFPVRDGISAWNTRTVPVGKRFARLAALCATFVFLEPRICGIGGNDSGRVEGWFLRWLGLWIGDGVGDRADFNWVGCASDGLCWVSFRSWFEPAMGKIGCGKQSESWFSGGGAIVAGSGCAQMQMGLWFGGGGGAIGGGLGCAQMQLESWFGGGGGAINGGDQIRSRVKFWSEALMYWNGICGFVRTTAYCGPGGG